MKRQTILKSALCFFMALVCLPMAMQAKVEHLLPKPQQVTLAKGTFALSGDVTITYSNGAAQCALLEEFFTTNGCAIAEGGKAVNVSLVESIEGAHDYALHGYENEAYTLEITDEEINITAVTATGVIRAAQTLTQLAEGWDGTKAIECLTMKDWPAFKLRGYMHDVGRSFISIDELVKQIELFSRFKVNTFHWHLTENQAWRFEVKAYPKLTSDASMTRFPGQYYTQEDCKRVMAVAKKHGVIVIPEIDMPGHSEAFERAMGFNMQTEEGKVVLKKVIDEAVEVFAGAPYIHIGGDEVTTTAAYLNEMIAYAESKGANVKGGLWNPINGIGQDALNNTLAQMWGTRGYLASGKANIDCRYNYTNHFDVFADLVGIYKSNIYYHDKGTTEVVGAISGCWNDRKVADEKAIMAQNNVWANVIATAERAWMGGGKQYIDNMTNTPADLKVDGGHGGTTLPNSGEEYEEFKSWEERFLFHKANSLKDEPIPYVKQTNVRWRITDAFPNGGDKTAAFGPETVGITASTDLLPETFTHEGKTYYSGMATGAGIYLVHTWADQVEGYYKINTQPYNHTAYAWTYVYSPEEQKVGAQIEFQNYSRSEQDAAPAARKWDFYDSKIWINGEEIAAPTWDNTGVNVSNKEVELKNENFAARKPIEVTLKQGWNKVFLKLPYMNEGCRLKKWMFTFVLTDLEGKNAVEGLIYSPNQCMDEATEAVAAKVSEIKRDRGNLIGTTIGLWDASLAATLDAKVTEIEATYSESKTAEERAAQVAALEEAWATFAASLTEAKMNKPVSGNYYRMYTPQRENRYPTGQGTDMAIIGEQNPTTNASIWQFVSRGDGSYDIINSANNTYIATSGDPLKCVTTRPNAGWTLKPASTNGLVILTCGTAQFNQGNSGASYKINNWGSGTNTTDGGCQYAFVEAEPIDRLMYNVSDGQYNERTGSDWRNGWTSTNEDKPTLAISVSANNMNAGSSEYIGMRPGQSGSSTYTLTLGEYFTNYSFEAKSTNASANHKITINGETTAVGTEWETFTVDVNSNTTQFKLEGGNNNDFYIRNIKFVQEVTDIEKFANGGVYTFVTARGKMGATEGNTKVISTARTSVEDTNTDFFKWTVYQSSNGNYYLYNLGKQQFMGMQTANNTEIDFVTTPAGRKLTFKQSSSADYPIMLSTDNAGVVNHSTNHGGGLINWTGGWNTLNDGGSNHQVTLVSKLPEATLQKIADKVEAYDRRLYVKAQVEGSWENNPNTHFGSVAATTSAGTLTSKLKTTPAVAIVDYDGSNETTISFTREYRGFEFQGYYAGEQELGKSFILTEALKNSITEANPLIAKFTATKDVTLFYDDDPKSYRIPAIATTSTGRIFAVSDYRHNFHDIGSNKFNVGTLRIDLVARYSDDNGKTWSETQTIAAGDDSKSGSYLRAFGDAAIAAVGENIVVMAAAGDIMYPYASLESPNKMARIFSIDNGKTWSIEEMTTKMYSTETSLIPDGVAAFFGSGKLVVDANFNNTQKARIYGALLVKIGNNNYNNFVVFSDDLGETWNILGGSQTPVANGDEPKVEILPNGQILLSARRQGGRIFNVFTYSDTANNTGTWDTAANGCGNGGSNGTNGEIFCLDAKKADGTAVKLLMQSQPKAGSGQYDRNDVTIWYKEIDANTTYTTATIKDNWIEGLQVSHQQSSYSAVTMQPDGKLAFFFEEAPCYGDDYNKGYCMVYAPLTVESITRGNYFSLTTNLDAASTINVILTDAQGNTYNDQLTECKVGEIATKLQEKYPFITLGDNVSLAYDGQAYTYTNTVTLPFKVSNSETTVWHNIYIPSNTQTRYPVYFYAESNANTTVKSKATSVDYGASDYNTQEHADKMSWAIYNVDNRFAFTFKNKLTGKYIKVSQPASGRNENVQYDIKENATAFSIEKNTSYRGDYIIKHETGHLSVYGAGDGYLTFFSGNYHWGSTAKIVEAPDFAALIAEVNTTLDILGTSLGQYTASDANAAAAAAAKEAMQNSLIVKLNTLNSYKNLIDGATLNMPQPDQYFRVAYDYGGNVGKLYMQSTTSSVKGLEFTAETGNASVWVYYDGRLYSYVEGKNLREDGNDRGLSETKTTAEFSASARAMGKYNIKVGSFVHANSSNGNYFTDHCSGNGCTQHDLILESVDMRPSAIVTTIGEHGIGTFYATSAMQIPEGVKAYVVAADDIVMNGETGYLAPTELEDIIPAETGVVIRGNAGYYTFTPAESAATTDVTNNLIRGYAGVFECEKVALPADGSTNYVLAVEGSQVGFYKKESAFKVYNNKAYLNIPASVAGARSLVIRFGDEETTDIENSEITNQNSEIVFDLQGRRVLTPTKGIYIVNGKKMVK